MSSAAPTRQPALPVITITKNDGSVYNFNPFHSPVLSDFKIKKASFTPPVDSKGGSFEMTVFAPDLANGTMNSILSNIENGNEINVWIGKSASSLTKVFCGVFENLTVNELTPDYMEVQLDGPDWGSDVLKNRIVLYYKVQRYLSDNITLDPNDPNVTVSQITSDLLTATLAYPFNDITAAAQGVVFSTNNIDASLQSVRIAQIMANMEHLDDKLSEVDNWCNAVHYIDPNKNFVMKPATPPPNFTPGTNTPGTWLFTDSVNDSLIATWTMGNVGYISGDGSSSYKYTTENYKARIIGIGGNQVAIDGSVLGTPVQQTTNSGSDNLSSTTWYAQKFTPVYSMAYSIALYVGLVGNPIVDLQIQIIQDNGGKPTGQVLATLSIPRSNISGAGWYQVNIPGEYLTPNPYWIVLPANPAYSALNTYTWYKGGAAFTSATSSDGVTWTPATGMGYMFIEYTQTPLKQALPGLAPAANAKVFHEETYRQAFITTRSALMPYLVSISKMTNYKKEVYKCKIYTPDNIPMPFSAILVRKISSGLAMNTSTSPASWILHILGSITWNFEASDEDTTGMLWMDTQLVRFTTFP
ncbi:MAG TPA: hypothetical protein VJ792_04295 [Candidatus Nitrosotalea sp.]|nr:hypothetical protein [Candidatus Nitrosotalea sp.]